MTTRVIIGSPKPNHKRVRVRIFNQDPTTVLAQTPIKETILDHGQLVDFEHYVHNSSFIVVDEVD